MQVDTKLSKHYANAAQMQSKNYRGHAFMVVQLLPDALYVEGFAVSRNGVVFEHGWVQYNGRIIDALRWDDEDTKYFPARHFTFPEARRLASRKTKTRQVGKLPVVWCHGQCDDKHPEYIKAHQDASAYSQSKRLINAPIE
jgi:hypothetical protein